MAAILSDWLLFVASEHPHAHYHNREMVVEVCASLVICKHNGVILSGQIIQAIRETTDLLIHDAVYRSGDNSALSSLMTPISRSASAKTPKQFTTLKRSSSSSVSAVTSSGSSLAQLRDSAPHAKENVYLVVVPCTQSRTDKGAMFANYHTHYLVGMFFQLLVIDTFGGCGSDNYPESILMDMLNSTKPVVSSVSSNDGANKMLVSSRSKQSSTVDLSQLESKSERSLKGALSTPQPHAELRLRAKTPRPNPREEGRWCMDSLALHYYPRIRHWSMHEPETKLRQTSITSAFQVVGRNINRDDPVEDDVGDLAESETHEVSDENQPIKTVKGNGKANKGVATKKGAISSVSKEGGITRKGSRVRGAEDGKVLVVDDSTVTSSISVARSSSRVRRVAG